MIRSSKSLEPIRKEYTRKIKTVGAVLVPAQPKRNTQHGITLVALIITIVLKRLRVGRYEECRI